MDEATLFGDRLLATKFFVPSSSHPLIVRPHLTTLLNQGLRCKLTLISAPPGFGKTTLLSAWVQSFPKDNPESPCVAWVSLDEGDNDPVLFWTYALTALDAQQPGFCTPLLSYLQAQQASIPPLRYFLQALINILVSSSRQFLLVLDDYHVIARPEIHDSLLYLLEHLPPQLHIMLATRADPPLPLSLMRARGEMLEVRTDQLRCTPEEVMAFFREVMDIQLTGDIIQKMTARTEGWLGGLQLLGLSLQRHADPANLLDEVSGSQHYILDYLVEEVLRRQAPLVQTFLLRTSILERLSASLCDTVLEHTGSQQMLEFLERANVFVVPLDGQRRWYRYHALFAEALRSRLELMESEAISNLHLRASYWYDEQGYLSEATRHAINARDWLRAADLIKQSYAFVWFNRKQAMVRSWLEKLPAEIVRSQPRLCFAYAKTLFMVAPYTTIAGWLHDAEMAVQASELAQTNEIDRAINPEVHLLSERSERDNLLGEIAAYRAIITGYHLGEAPATLAFCQQALTYLSEQNLAVRAEVAYAQSMAYHSSGDIVASVQYLREASALAQAVGNTSSTIFYLCRMAYSLSVYGNLHEVVQIAENAVLMGTTPIGLSDAVACSAYIFQGDVLREWNRLDEALDCILQGIQLCEQTETIVSLYFGYTDLMRVYMARGEMEAAHAAFLRAEESLAKVYSSYRRDVYIIGDWVQFWLASGALDRAECWAQQLVRHAGGDFSLVRERQDVARARILLAQKRPAEALSLLDPLQDNAQKQERLSHVIEMKVLQTLAYSMCQQEQEALSTLSQTVLLAEPEGYIRSFVDAGTPMAALLSRLQEQKRKQGPTPYLDIVLAAFPQHGTKSEQPPVRSGRYVTVQPLQDPLSERELEVLRLVIRGNSNQEIAATLVLSIDTIKRHVSNIFSKLGVHTRVQAVARIRALGLLSDEV